MVVDAVLRPVDPNDLLSFGQQNSVVSTYDISDHLCDQVICLIVEVDFTDVAVKALLAFDLAHTLVVRDVDQLDVVLRSVAS